MIKNIRIIGDVHGKYQEYLNLIKNVDLSIQVGDLGFYYDFLNEVDSNKHIVILGNHDNYDESKRFPKHLLSAYGWIEFNEFKFFYVRGAFSIDWKLREQKRINQEWPRTWWQNEELSQAELNDALYWYEKHRPDFVITHEAPRSVIHNITDGRVLIKFGYDPLTFTTRTSDTLEKMFKIHQPKTWVFGHYHRSASFKVGNTNFQCLAELEYKDFVYETIS